MLKKSKLMHSKFKKFKMIVYAAEKLTNVLTYSNCLNDKVTNEIILFINILIDQNYFGYDKMFSQNDGFTVGSLLSAILSGLYRQNYESIFNAHSKPQHT